MPILYAVVIIVSVLLALALGLSLRIVSTIDQGMQDLTGDVSYEPELIKRPGKSQ